MLELDATISDGAGVPRDRSPSTPMLDDSAAAPAAPPARLADRGSQPMWLAVWPKVAAVAIGLAIWQLVVWSGWRPEYVLPAARDRVPAPRRAHRRRHRVRRAA